jgi:hypothetical protein
MMPMGSTTAASDILMQQEQIREEKSEKGIILKLT